MRIVIFGCGNIGFETVKNLSKCRFVDKIYIFNHSYPEHLKEFTEQNPKESKIIRFFQVDAEDACSVEKAFSALIKEKIDVFICTVGVRSSVSILEDFNKFKCDFDSNVFGNIIPIITAINTKILNIGARILVISSVSGHFAPNDLKSYASSKWALENLISSLAIELKSQKLEFDIISPTTIQNKYSKGFVSTIGIDTSEVVKVIRKIIVKMNE